ncbi:MAG TPA: energy transducer TonB [Allosphingosinicella sp.]
MISYRISLLLGALTCAGAAPAAQPVAPPPIYAPPPFRPAPPPPPAPPRDWSAPRPRTPGLEVVGGPDWGDPDIYPLRARALEQEGPVSFVLLVGTDGRPRSCELTASSGYFELDDATCTLGMTMRFARPRTETRVPFRVVWMLSPEAIPFEPQRMVAWLDLAGGRVVGCTLSGTGGLVDEWRRVACRTFGVEAEYYLGARRWTSRRAMIVVDFLPEGTIPPSLVFGTGTLIAVRRTGFEIDPDGDPGACRTLEDRGFGRPRIDHADACGFFLSRGHTFAEAEEDAPPRRGRIEVRVLAEPAPPRRTPRR